MIERISSCKLLISKKKNSRMIVDGIIYADEYIEKFLDAQSVRQVENVACLPGIVSKSMAMPDIHAGYGFPIGGVAAFDAENGIISPGGVGYDINCGVRLIRTDLVEDEVRNKKEKILYDLFASIPLGVGSRGKIRLSRNEGKQVVLKGANWAVEKGFGDRADLERIESGGFMEGANCDVVSGRAFERGEMQEGTLGSGNHFLEIQRVEEIYDDNNAEILGIQKGMIMIMLHTGSRGFGHQICTDFIREMQRASEKYGIYLPDRQLACAPFQSPEGQRYYSAMKAAANYAWANRQILGHLAVESLMRALSKSFGYELIYDVAHNIAKVEAHKIGGIERRLVVHRKGATRAFGPGHPELPAFCRNIGQPVIIPGDMGRCSYILLGMQRAMEETFGSTCHGAGRIMSRGEARRKNSPHAVAEDMRKKGILVKSDSKSILSEEMSGAYKNVSNVVDVAERAGISKKVAKLAPLIVVKG